MPPASKKTTLRRLTQGLVNLYAMRKGSVVGRCLPRSRKFLSESSIEALCQESGVAVFVIVGAEMLRAAFVLSRWRGGAGDSNVAEDLG